MGLFEFLSYAVCFLAGGAVVYLLDQSQFMNFMRILWKDHENFKEVMASSPRDGLSDAVGVGSLVEASTRLEKYEIVFDADLVSYFATGSINVNWWDFLAMLEEGIDVEKLPSDVNTIIIRTVKFSNDGDFEFTFSAVNNPNLQPLDERESNG